MRRMRPGDDDGIAIRKIVGDLLTTVVGVVALDTDLGELLNDLRKV